MRVIRFLVGLVLAVAAVTGADAQYANRFKPRTAPTNEFVRGISPDGTILSQRPVCGDLSNAATSCSVDTTNAGNIASGTLPAGRVPWATDPLDATSTTVVSPSWFRTAAASLIANVPTAGAATFQPSTTAALSQGVASIAVTNGGASGTNGTFAGSSSGGGCTTQPIWRFTVQGGAVVSTLVQNTGNGCTSNPTLSFSASSGLTGVVATPVLATNVPVGGIFAVAGTSSIAYFRNDSGSATPLVEVGNNRAVYRGSGDPGINTGRAGDGYIDTASGTNFNKRTDGLWETTASSPRVAPTLIDFTQPVTTWSGYLTVTRAAGTNGTSTNLLISDVAGYAYQTFPSANTPRTRSDKGVGFFHAGTNYLANSANASTQTTPSLPTGFYRLWGNSRDGSNCVYDLSAGTAVGTGWGPLTVAPNASLLVNVTTAGTAVFTKSSGGVCAAQLERQDVVGRITPVPFIETGATVPGSVPADVGVAAGALFTTFSGTTGAAVFTVRDTNVASTSTLALAGNSRVYLNLSGSNHVLGYFRSPDFATRSTGGPLFSGNPVKAAVGWSGSTITLAAGNTQPAQSSFTWNGGSAVASVNIGGTNTDGQNALDGWIQSIEFYQGARPIDADIFARVNALFTTDIVRNWQPGVSMPSWRAAIARAIGGTDSTALFLSDSNGAGIDPSGTTNTRATSIPVYLGARLRAAGLPVFNDSVFGNAPAGALTTYDTRNTRTGTITSWGTSCGGSASRMAAGATWSFRPGTRNTDAIRAWFWRGGGTYRMWLGSAGSGTLLATVDTSGTAGLASSEQVTTSGDNTYTIEAVGQVDIAGMVAHLSTQGEVSLINCAYSGATTTLLTNGSNVPLSSMENFVRSIAPATTIVSIGTNDINTLIARATTRTNVNSIITYARASGDVLAFSPVVTLPNDASMLNFTQPYATQIQYVRDIESVYALAGVPYIDIWYGLGGDAAPWINAGYWTDSVLHYNSLMRSEIARMAFRVLSVQ